METMINFLASRQPVLELELVSNSVTQKSRSSLQARLVKTGRWDFTVLDWYFTAVTTLRS